MFKDFLTHRADIYPIEHTTSNRTAKDQVANKTEPEFTNIPCRISKERILFMPEIELESGDVILSEGKKYQIIARASSIGRDSIHHNTYEIKKGRFE